ncbi:MAG: sporulation transcriptional regulator SpoIIID [Clostridia bacterium]|nr:sporulation transcriptional regulator SpoIIID [Clostridia bacterium]
MQNFENRSRPEQLGHYITRNKATVRDAAAYFGISKSTVHKDVTVELAKQNYGLFLEVNGILQFNKKERHLRGGEATRKKYEEAKKRGRH